jgi:hypothetical protein
MELAEHVARPGNTPNSKQFPRFHQLNQICQRLADLNLLTVINRGSWDSHDASYFWTNDLLLLSDKERKDIIRLLNYMVYGFLVTFEDFKNSILPIIHYDKEETPAIGTAFIIAGSPTLILTAAHCVTDAKAIFVRGISGAEFRDAEIFVSKNHALDIAMIIVKCGILPNAKRLELGYGKVLDEVIAVGYPNVPTFTEVLAEMGNGDRLVFQSKHDQLPYGSETKGSENSMISLLLTFSRRRSSKISTSPRTVPRSQLS